jgi:NTE family protein
VSAQPKTAFVLAGGGSFGAAQVGMLRALCAHGVRPDLVAGSSVGAINGSFYAATPNPEGIARLEAVWRKLRRRDVFPISLGGLLGALAGGDHLFEPTGLRRLLASHLPCATLEASAVPMHVVATDLMTGAPVRLSSGPTVDAVLASCAIPAIYPPARLGDRQLIDGAVACNTPIRTAVELGATRLILLPTAFACPHSAPPRGVFASAFHAMDLFVMQQLVQDTQLFAQRAQIFTVPPICPLAIASYDFSRSGELIELAARSTEQWISRGGLSGSESITTTFRRTSTQPDSHAVRANAERRCDAQLPSCTDPQLIQR